jgi:hypothetical protein
MLIMLIGCYSLMVLVLLPILIDYINGSTHVRSLDIAAQIKIMEEP